MKKGLLSMAFVGSMSMAAFAAGNADKVLMTVGNDPVTLGEFEYLYHKNNSQQMTPQSIDEYLQMFITYKQKVADAEAAGIADSPEFKKEFAGYRRELADPYMRDQAVEDSIVNAIYNRMKEDVRVSHIMLASHGEGINPAAQRTRLDSIRTAILAGSDFSELARQFSIDRSVVNNGGDQGWVVPMRFPYQFEDAAYNTPVGEISPVIETPYGYHIVLVTDRRPARGQVLVEHILKLTQGLDEEGKAEKRHQIDSIAALLADGGDFEAIARIESEDPGTKSQGGRLQRFGAGRMVPEFEEAAFALADGETSGVVETAYGFHIIRKLDHRDIEPFENVQASIKQTIQQDSRGAIPRERRIQQLFRKFKVKKNDKAIKAITARLQNGVVDSVLTASMQADKTVLATIGKQKITVADIAPDMANLDGSPEELTAIFNGRLDQRITDVVEELERQDLAVTNADYRNLLNEYRDGMLLFEISDRNVWRKAKEDKAGLEQYFRDHRANYAWGAPKYKGYVVFATSDSLLVEVKNFLAPCTAPGDQLADLLRDHFGKEVKIDKVIAAKGENAITDYLGFGGEKPEPKGKWQYYFGYRDRVVDAPEEASDVRGTVTGDYQNQLEELWIEQLRSRYPAKINEKVLKEVQ